MQVPIYLITGFLESGKTSFIQQVIVEGNFVEDEKTLLIVTEEGVEEYDTDILKRFNVDLVTVEDKKDFTPDFLRKLRREYRPMQVIIEYNGMWPVSEFVRMQLPFGWELYQVVTTVDASTFQLYLNNMRSLIADMIVSTSMVIFNRCKEDTDLQLLLRNVRVLNSRTEMVFEAENGDILDPGDDILPFDIQQDPVTIEDEDYGIWYLDALDHPEHYEGKQVQIKGMVFKSKNFDRDYFVPGRMAMTCCADDITFLGFMCKSRHAVSLKNKQWVRVTAEVHSEYKEEYHGVGPVLYAKKIEGARKPEEEMVYFN